MGKDTTTTTAPNKAGSPSAASPNNQTATATQGSTALAMPGVFTPGFGPTMVLGQAGGTNLQTKTTSPAGRPKPQAKTGVPYLAKQDDDPKPDEINNVALIRVDGTVLTVETKDGWAFSCGLVIKEPLSIGYAFTARKVGTGSLRVDDETFSGHANMVPMSNRQAEGEKALRLIEHMRGSVTVIILSQAPAVAGGGGNTSDNPGANTMEPSPAAKQQDDQKQSKSKKQSGQGGIRVSNLATEEDIAFLKKALKEIFGTDKNDPEKTRSNNSTYISIQEIRALRQLMSEQEPLKSDIIKELRSNKGKKDGEGYNPTLETLIEIAREKVEMAEEAKRTGYKPAEASEDDDARKPIYNRPVRGNIITTTSPASPNKKMVYEFTEKDHRSTFAVPHVFIKWKAYRVTDPTTKALSQPIDQETTNYIDINPDGILNDKTFDLKFPSNGVYEVHAWVHHSFYLPAHFKHTEVVKTESQWLQDMEKESMKDFGTPTYAGSPNYSFADVASDESWTKTFIGIGLGPVGGTAMAITDAIVGGTGNERGFKTTGQINPELLKQEGFANSTRKLDEQIKQVEELLTYYKEKGANTHQDLQKWAQDRLTKLKNTRKQIEDLRKDGSGNVAVATQAYYVSRKKGIQSGQMALACWFTYNNGKFEGHLFDHSEIVRNEYFHFRASHTNFDAMMEALFFQITSTYPKGSMSLSYHDYQLNSGLVEPQNTFTRLERKTDTLLKDIQEVVFSPEVSIVVNIVSAVLSVFPPTAPIGIGLSLVYNGADVLLQMKDAIRTDTVKASNYVDIGLLALDIIPILGKATKIISGAGKVAKATQNVSKTYRVLSVGNNIAQLAGNAYILTEQGFNQIAQLRDGLIQDLARTQENIKLLQEARPMSREQATLLQQEIRRQGTLEKNIRSAATDVFSQLVAQQALTITSTKVAAHLTQKAASGQPITQADLQDPGNLTSRDRAASSQMNGVPNYTANASLTQVVTDAGINGVKVFDSGVDDATVKVHYEKDGWGGIRRIIVEAGTKASAQHIKDHLGTIQTLRSYQGVGGRLKVAGTKLQQMITNFLGYHDTKQGPDPYSLAWESSLELQKLKGIMERHTQALQDTTTPLSAKDKQYHEAEVQSLQDQITYYEGLIKQMDPSSGRGFVANQDLKRANEVNKELKKLKGAAYNARITALNNDVAFQTYLQGVLAQNQTFNVIELLRHHNPTLNMGVVPTKKANSNNQNPGQSVTTTTTTTTQTPPSINNFQKTPLSNLTSQDLTTAAIFNRPYIEIDDSKLIETPFEGGNKKMYGYESEPNLVVLVLKTNDANAIQKELQHLDTARQAGIPVAVPFALTKVNGMDAIVSIRASGASKELVSISGSNARYNKVSDGGNTVLQSMNQTTINQLEAIKQQMLGQGSNQTMIKIDDFQLLIYPNGEVRLFDPLNVELGKKPSDKSIKKIDRLIALAQTQVTERQNLQDPNYQAAVQSLIPAEARPTLKTPAATVEENQGALLTQIHGLQTRHRAATEEKPAHFDITENTQVLKLKKGNPKGFINDGIHDDIRFLWTIDDRGINIALESTTVGDGKQKIKHTNLSSKAYIGGECIFYTRKDRPGERFVWINNASGRFGRNTSRQQMAAVRSAWIKLGYTVKFGKITYE